MSSELPLSFTIDVLDLKQSEMHWRCEEISYETVRIGDWFARKKRSNLNYGRLS